MFADQKNQNQKNIRIRIHRIIPKIILCLQEELLDRLTHCQIISGRQLSHSHHVVSSNYKNLVAAIPTCERIDGLPQLNY